MKIGVPVTNAVVSSHFGHCEKFYVVEIIDSKIGNPKMLTPPPHEPGVIPKWLSGQDVTLVLAGGIGSRAVGLFESFGIKVIMGVPSVEPEAVVNEYINGTLKSGENVCEH